ncbi:hypothetical protein J3459_014998 [Metarhizium acridum]|nr:hypothetical protein J3459_014998 [Metarhizium acridum]
MEQQDPHDDLSPLADLTSAAHERMSYVRAQGTRRLSRRAVLNRSLSLGRTSFEPVVPSPLGQPSWNQDSVPTPEGSPVEPHGDDDGPRLDEGYDKEPVILHPAGLEGFLPRKVSVSDTVAFGIFRSRLYEYLVSILLSTGAYSAACNVTCRLDILPRFTAVGGLQYRFATTSFAVSHHFQYLRQMDKY